jgi:hypothetical protein
MKLAYLAAAAEAAAVVALAGCSVVTPTAPPPHSSAPVTLLKWSGSGQQLESSKSFTPGGGAMIVSYSFDCSSLPKSGNFFTADMTGQGSGLLDNQYATIAKQLNVGDVSGHGTTSVHPKYPYWPYSVEVASDCSWSISVTQG